MIKVRLNETKTGHLSLSVKGHSGAAEIGQDIVCASASILAYTIAQLVKDYINTGKVKNNPKILLKSGRSSVSCTPFPEYYDEVKHSFFVVQTGFNLLAHNYPQYVDIEMFNNNEGC